MRVLLLAWCLMTASPMARADTWNATYDAYVAGANALRLTAAIEVGAGAHRWIYAYQVPETPRPVLTLDSSLIDLADRAKTPPPFEISLVS